MFPKLFKLMNAMPFAKLTPLELFAAPYASLG